MWLLADRQACEMDTAEHILRLGVQGGCGLFAARANHNSLRKPSKAAHHRLQFGVVRGDIGSVSATDLIFSHRHFRRVYANR